MELAKRGIKKMRRPKSQDGIKIDVSELADTRSMLTFEI
jgi:hypothetical protein